MSNRSLQYTRLNLEHDRIYLGWPKSPTGRTPLLAELPYSDVTYFRLLRLLPMILLLPFL
jgi:hypothetical protein